MSLRYRRVLTPIVCTGLLLGYGSLAMTPASAATIQEDHNVEVHDHKHGSDAEAKIEVILTQDDKSSDQNLMNKVIKVQGINIHNHGSDTAENVKFVVLGEDGTEQEGLLQKLTGHKVLLRNLNAGSVDGKNIFVVKSDGDQEGEVEVELHRHIAKIVQGKVSGNFDNKAMAKQLRQIADQLEAQDNRPLSAHNIHRDTETQSGASHKFRIEKRNLNKKVVDGFKLQSVPGKHVVIGKPGESKKMVIELKSANGESHGHSKQKKVIVLGKGQNVVVEGIHVDGDHDPSELARKIMKQVEGQGTKLNIEVENVLQKALQQVELSTADIGKTSEQGNRQTLDELKQELDGLRRELDQLRADRKSRSKRQLN